MRKEIAKINANGSACTAYMLAHIATQLETYGAVLVTNVAKPMAPLGPGAAAFHLGQFLQEAMQAKKEGKF